MAAGRCRSFAEHTAMLVATLWRRSCPHMRENSCGASGFPGSRSPLSFCARERNLDSSPDAKKSCPGERGFRV